MKRNDIIFLLTSIVILSIAWVIFSVIHASTASTIASDVNKEIEPIAATFDMKTITTLQARQSITPIYTFQTIPNAPITSIPNASSNSAQPTVPTSSPSPFPTSLPTLPLALSPTPSPIQGGNQ